MITKETLDQISDVKTDVRDMLDNLRSIKGKLHADATELMLAQCSMLEALKCGLSCDMPIPLILMGMSNSVDNMNDHIFEMIDPDRTIDYKALHVDVERLHRHANAHLNRIAEEVSRK